MAKLFIILSEGERNPCLHRRRRAYEVRVIVYEILNYRITHTTLTRMFVKKKPAESMIIKKEDMDVKYT